MFQLLFLVFIKFMPPKQIEIHLFLSGILSVYVCVCVISTFRFLNHLEFLKIHGIDLFFLIHRWGGAPVKLSHRIGCGFIGPDGQSLPIPDLVEFLIFLSSPSILLSPLQIHKKYVCVYVYILTHTHTFCVYICCTMYIWRQRGVWLKWLIKLCGKNVTSL